MNISLLATSTQCRFAPGPRISGKRKASQRISRTGRVVPHFSELLRQWYCLNKMIILVSVQVHSNEYSISKFSYCFLKLKGQADKLKLKVDSHYIKTWELVIWMRSELRIHCLKHEKKLDVLPVCFSCQLWLKHLVFSV